MANILWIFGLNNWNKWNQIDNDDSCLQLTASISYYFRYFLGAMCLLSIDTYRREMSFFSILFVLLSYIARQTWATCKTNPFCRSLISACWGGVLKKLSLAGLAKLSRLRYSWLRFGLASVGYRGLGVHERPLSRLTHSWFHRAVWNTSD